MLFPISKKEQGLLSFHGAWFSPDIIILKSFFSLDFPRISLTPFKKTKTKKNAF